MSRAKPEAPYNRLKRYGCEYADRVDNPKTREMIHIGNLTPVMHDVQQRVIAANTLGYDVIVTATDKGLHFDYVEKRPRRPWEFRW